jgi:transmembrane sensor
MSDSSGGISATPNAKDIGEQAADWIQRRAFWAWTEREEALLNAWLAESLAHRIAYTRVEAAWMRTARVAALRSSGSTRESVKRGRVSRTLLRTATALAVTTAVGIGTEQYFRVPSEATYETAIGGHETIRLVDGSQIELNTDTILKTSPGANRGVVKLIKGEAFFSIKHDRATPLTVIVGNHRITDLGTKFVVSSEPNRLEVALVEGRAAFGAADGRGEPPIVLMPGDSLLVADNQITTTRKPAQMLADELGWRHGLLVFENASLGDAATEINRYNVRKIVIADQAVARMRISASFPTTRVEDFVQLAHQLLGLKVDRYDDKIIISR